MQFPKSKQATDQEQTKYRKLTAADFLTDFANFDQEKELVYGFYQVKVQKNDMEVFEQQDKAHKHLKDSILRYIMPKPEMIGDAEDPFTRIYKCDLGRCKYVSLFLSFTFSNFYLILI